MPAIRYGMDAEAGHKFAVKVLASGFAPRDMSSDDEALGVELWGHRLSNPVGLAAGFDKDGEAIDGLFNLGFSWVEVGSVTPKPQDGNPKPRVFHLPEDSAIINRYGFPSQGHAIVLSRLRSYIATHPPSAVTPSILALNLGKNKSSAPDSTSDFLNGVAKFGPLVDVLVINVSSPNTAGLRALQGRGVLEELLSEVIKARDGLPTRSTDEWKWEKAKIVVKIAPDLSEKEVQDIAEAVTASGVDGVIVSNTTIQRPAELKSINAVETGGLSGPPVKPLTLATLKTLRGFLPSSVPIIGCGGISSGSDAVEYAEAGATLVQLYTSFAYDGVGAPRRVKDEVSATLAARKTTWNEVVKSAAEKFSWKQKNAADLFKDVQEELKSTLDEAGKKVAFGDELVLLKDKVLGAVPVLDVALPSLPAVGDVTTPHTPAPEPPQGKEKTIKDLIKEAEAALGLPSSSS
ncbi:Dihydroorotate dehydrogenase (quinone), mitochondrial [Tulasnella sp. 427]|nr:Dihydroorotate dehydrogenase (quinone), mitochondrial [Tulasnella sp. 427]